MKTKLEVCVGNVARMVEVTEECTPDGVSVLEVYLYPFNGEDAVLLYDRGNNSAAGDEFGFSITGPEVTGDFTRKFTLNGTYPQGSHTFEVKVTDGCGNRDANFIEFTVV